MARMMQGAEPRRLFLLAWHGVCLLLVGRAVLVAELPASRSQRSDQIVGGIGDLVARRPVADFEIENGVAGSILDGVAFPDRLRTEEPQSELQSQMRIS